MKYNPDILLHAASLKLGENVRVVCPMCGGGSTKEKSLSITLENDGTLKWNCFRAKCESSRGTTFTYGNQLEKAVKKKTHVFKGTTEALTDKAKVYIALKWGIKEPPEHWYWTDDYGGRIAMSIRSPMYVHRGWVLRAVNPNSKKKALTFVDEGEQGISWYKTQPQRGTVIVEDIPSAVRASKYINAVALLGTGVGEDRALEIATHAPRPIIMALDQDATELSFKWAQKYKLLWEDVKVYPLKNDIKNMEEDRICRMFT